MRRQYNRWMLTVEDPGSVRFIDAWTEYVSDYSQRYKASSTDTLRRRGQAYFIPAFENRRLKAITRADWQGVIDKAAARKLARKTLSGIANSITMFLRFCAARGYVSEQDVINIFHISPRAATKQRRALYPDELQELLSDEVTYESWYVPMFRFLVYTGLRRGELCALQTARDWAEPYLTIRETISHELTVGTPKSGKPRTEYVNPLALEALQDHLARRKAEGFDDCPYLFCSSRGGRINPKVLSDAWRTYRKAHDLGDVTLHELRHTYATYTDKTLTLEELKQMLGHSKSMATQQTYVHDVPLTEAEKLKKLRDDQERAERIKQVFDLISGQN